jgi:hypothetical protein
MMTRRVALSQGLWSSAYFDQPNHCQPVKQRSRRPHSSRNLSPGTLRTGSPRTAPQGHLSLAIRPGGARGCGPRSAELPYVTSPLCPPRSDSALVGARRVRFFPVKLVAH